MLGIRNMVRNLTWKKVLNMERETSNFKFIFYQFCHVIIIDQIHWNVSFFAHTEEKAMVEERKTNLLLCFYCKIHTQKIATGSEINDKK